MLPKAEARALRGVHLNTLPRKMREGKAVIAIMNKRPVGFCYVEAWSHGRFVANSGLIVAEECRQSGLARRIKKETFKLSRRKYPNAKNFQYHDQPCSYEAQL